MSLEAEKGIFPVHAATVITHRHKAGSAAKKFHPDFPGSGVQAVLNQFFDQRGWTLHDFPCRNLAGNVIRQQTNLSHDLKWCRSCQIAAAKTGEFSRTVCQSKFLDCAFSGVAVLSSALFLGAFSHAHLTSYEFVLKKTV